MNWLFVSFCYYFCNWLFIFNCAQRIRNVMIWGRHEIEESEVVSHGIQGLGNLRVLEFCF